MSKKRDEQGDAAWQPPMGRWSPDDGRAMLAALAASGETLSGFAGRVGIPAHRVSYWRARFGGAPARSESAQGSGGGFVAVTVRDAAPPALEPYDGARAPRIEVTLVNGRRATFAGHWDVAAIGPWLRALEVA